MFKLLTTKKFWKTYTIICLVCFVVSVLLSNLFGLAGKDVTDTQHTSLYFYTLFLLLPLVMIPGFLLIALIQRFKPQKKRLVSESPAIDSTE